MTGLVDSMEALSTLLNSGGVKAFHDPAKAHNNMPCLLVTPPVLTGGTLDGEAAREWQIVALSGREAGTLDAVKQLELLVAHVDSVVGFTRAEPARYTLTTAKPPVAAYLCQTTEYA